MKSTFFEWRCNKVTEYFSSRKEVSIPQRIAYKCLISWIGNASLAVICFLFANTVNKMMKQRFKSSRENFSPLLNKSRSRRACWIQVKKIHQLTIERSALKGQNGSNYLFKRELSVSSIVFSRISGKQLLFRSKFLNWIRQCSLDMPDSHTSHSL